MERQPGIETGVFMYEEDSFMIAITELFCFLTFKGLSKTYQIPRFIYYTI